MISAQTLTQKYFCVEVQKKPKVQFQKYDVIHVKIVALIRECWSANSPKFKLQLSHDRILHLRRENFQIEVLSSRDFASQIDRRRREKISNVELP